eukprot:Colp12_sorted_trinity150504_noHs@21897
MDEYDEQIVNVEIEGVLDKEFLNACAGKYTMIGLDTPTPILKMGEAIFRGEYKESMGSCMIFKETKNEEGKPSLKYEATSNKKLVFTRVFIEKKGQEKRQPPKLNANHLR